MKQTTQTQNDPLEVAIFLISKLLSKYPTMPYENIIGGLRNAGVPESIINKAWYRATTETDV